MARGPWLSGPLAPRPTHSLPICAEPRGWPDVGFVNLYVAALAPERPCAGLHAMLALPAATFSHEPAALLRLLEQATRALQADVAAIGPGRASNEHNGVWALTSATDRYRSLAGRFSSSASPSILVAHDGAPDLDTLEARTAREALGRARRGDAAEMAPSAEIANPAGAAFSPAAPPDLPSSPIRLPPNTPWNADADGTLPIAVARPENLPFRPGAPPDPFYVAAGSGSEPGAGSDGGTCAIRPGDLEQATLPFMPRGEWTTTRFASTSVQLDMLPARRAEILAANELTEARWDQMCRVWQRRMDADPRLLHEVTDLRRRFRAYFEGVWR